MDKTDILAIAIQLLQKRFDLNLESSEISKALQMLIGTVDGKIDIQGLVAQFMSHRELHSMIGSWLGNGPNTPLPVKTIFQIFGEKKITQFAEQLGVEEHTATEGLAEIIPQLLDTASNAGSLQEENLASVMNLAKNIF